MEFAIEQARSIALDRIKMLEALTDCELILLDAMTIERSFGWVFFYGSKAYVESGQPSDALAGNAPFVLMRADGAVRETGTAMPLEYYLKDMQAGSP